MPASKTLGLLVIGLIVGAAIGYGVSFTAKPATPTAPASKTYTLGVVFPLTGTLADFGKSFVNAVNLAVDQMNAKLADAGNPVKFATAVADDQGTPAGALTAFQSVYQSTSAQVFVGPLTTAEVLGVRDFAQTNHIVFLPPASSGTAAAVPFGSVPFHSLVRPGQPGDLFEGNALGQLIVQSGMKSVVYLYRADTSGIGKFNVTTGVLKSAGVTWTGIQITPNQADYSSEVASASSGVAKIVSGGGSYSTTAVVVDDYGTEIANIFKHSTTDTYLSKVKWFGVEALNDNALLSDSSINGFMAHVNLTITTLYTPSSPQGKDFLSSFQAKYGGPPEPFSNYAYDCAWIAMESVLVAGSYSGPAVLAVVVSVADHYFGVTGTGTYLDKNGDQGIAFFEIDKCVYSGGKYQYVQIGLYDGSANKVTLTGQ